MKIKQSVCLPIIQPPDIPHDKFLPAVAEIGYQAVEIWDRKADFEQFARLCAENGLVLVSMIGHNGIDSGLNDPAQHARIESELRESIDIAARHGISGIICFSGNRRPELDDETAIANTVQGLRRIAPYAEEKAVNLNLELLNSKIDHAGYQCDHSAWGVEVCRQVDSPRVKLLYDIYHMQIMEGDVIRTIRENIRWIGHFHTAGVPGRFDIDDTQELNYRAISQAIAATEYDLYMGHEFHAKGDPLAALRQAFKICDVD